jgi:hypothetical protein
MSSKITRRGFDIEDYKWFSKESVDLLNIAQQDVQWLLDRGYKLEPIIELVGGHYQLTSRQRMALQRGTSTQIQYNKRQSTMLPIESMNEGCVYIDGFNLIITLEVALSGSVLILGSDGVLRDLAGLRGSYSIIDKTEKVLELIGDSLKELMVPKVKFFLDSPVSNSGRLKSRIFEHSIQWGIPTDVELVPNADTVLTKMGRIITGDSILLDECQSWFNFSRYIIDEYIEDALIVSLNNNQK